MGKLTDDEIRRLSKSGLITHLGLGYPDFFIGHLVAELDLPSNVDNAKADPLDRVTKLINFVDSELSHHDLDDLKEKLIELRAEYKAHPRVAARPPADPKILPAPVHVPGPTPAQAQLPPSAVAESAAEAVARAGRQSQEPDQPGRRPDADTDAPHKTTPPAPPAAVDKPAPKPAPAARFTNSFGMTMVRIEPGEFLRGSTKAQINLLLKQFPGAKGEWLDWEQPQHPVRITKPFYRAAHPVTVGQFREFIEGSGCSTVNEWRDAGFDQGEDHPVVKVSHDDAVAFLNWLNDQEKGQNRSYRLPTEAEWEYACRAGGKGVYGTGDDPAKLDSIAWYSENSHGATHPVGQKEANRFGLYDMLGNVWEWCDDWFDENFYKSSFRQDPRNTNKAPFRVIRGGGWYDFPGLCRPAFRNTSAPDDRNDDLGFRVAAVQ